MRPLPRLHAITDAAVLGREDFPVRAAALAAMGPAVALHARDRSAGGARLTEVARRLLALARPPEAAVFVNARPDLAAALDAHGVQLGHGDLDPGTVRRAFPAWQGWIGASVHSPDEAEAARAAGADFLLVGSVYSTPTHADRVPAGPDLVTRVAKLGLPVIAIGGVTAAHVPELRQAGAYGVAAIRALWDAPDSARAAVEFLAPMLEDA